ncbi:ribokinase [Frigoribacterium sp. PvP032]|uniref:ribokinase n=1 Tax=Frigoribacterium sp. PvP032 TaxID=2806589 RepID=UPI001AE5BBC6|nr:ribokinase [Frigoribacterium sp. PvP032]MBP1191805.1 ribokinase [Frigoribacterium sp. PvP032]
MHGSAEVAGAGVVVVGSINVDQVVTVDRLPLPGETLIGTSMTLLPGGKGANQAVAAARRGAATTMIGAVGDDVHASAALPLLVGSGVDVERVAVTEGPTGLAVVSVGSDSENTIVVVPGANASVDEEAVARHADVVSRAAVVVLQGEIPVSGIERAARLATGRLVLNLAPVVAVSAEVVRLADPLVLNEHEGRLLLELVAPEAAERLAGRDASDDSTGASPAAASSGASAASSDSSSGADAAVVGELRALGVASVVLTRGAAGALVSDASGSWSVPSPQVRAVDSSGAGDAFVGALSAALAAGSSLLEAAQEAVRVGAYSVTTAGTQPSYPGVDDELPSTDEQVTALEVRA